MGSKENAFKVCGLCSQLVDQSVHLDPAFSTFLLSYLEIGRGDLPTKVCTDCFQLGSDARKFKERCGRAISKLKNTKLSDDMILGKSAGVGEDDFIDEKPLKKGTPTPKAAKAKAGPASKKKGATNGAPKPLPSFLDTDLIIEGGRKSRRSEPPAVSFLEELPPRSSRNGGAGPKSRRSVPAPVREDPLSFDFPSRRGSSRGRGSGNDKALAAAYDCRTCKIGISKVEHSLAEQAAADGGTMLYGKKRRGALITPKKGPASKRRKTEVNYGGDEDEDPLAVSTNGFDSLSSGRKRSRGSNGTAAASPAASVSSFGRTRTPRKGIDVVDFEDGDDLDPLDTASLSRSKPKSSKKAGPASKKGKGKAKPGKKSFYYVDDNGTEVSKDPIAADPEPEEEDVGGEEIFPSVGPYQCEICQEITDTKLEFVNHIKKFHRNVVDEGVLRSLEQDLKKSKAKKQVNGSPASKNVRRRQGASKGGSSKKKAAAAGKKRAVAATKASNPAPVPKPSPRSQRGARNRSNLGDNNTFPTDNTTSPPKSGGEENHKHWKKEAVAEAAAANVEALAEQNPLELETNPLEDASPHAESVEDPCASVESADAAAEADDPTMDTVEHYEESSAAIAEDPVATPETIEQQVEMQMSVEAEAPTFQPDTTADSYYSVDPSAKEAQPDPAFLLPPPAEPVNTSWHSVMDPSAGEGGALMDLDALTAAASDAHTQGMMSPHASSGTMAMPETPPKPAENLPNQIFY